MQTDDRAFLDRPAARLVAALVILLCAGLLAYIHRDDVRHHVGVGHEGGRGEALDGDPAAACIEQRFAEIDGMIDDGVVEPGQADLFKQRAEAMCRATEGDGAGPPLPLPGQ